MNSITRRVLMLVLICCMFSGSAYATTDNDSLTAAGETIDVFVDCSDCDMNFLRMNIP